MGWRGSARTTDGEWSFAAHQRGATGSRIARQGAVWSLVADDATVGSSELTAAVQFDTATHPPTLTGLVGGRRLAFADLAPTIGADKAPRETSRVLPDEPFDLPSLAQMQAHVRVDLAQVDFGTPNITPITDLQVHLELADSRLKLSQLSDQPAGRSEPAALVCRTQFCRRRPAALDSRPEQRRRVRAAGFTSLPERHSERQADTDRPGQQRG